jgi:pimeloyl-ACP methyl ester carboxylesterase
MTLVSHYHARDGALLAYQDEGPRGALPLLFVHGWQAHGRVWAPLLDAFEREHRVLIPDLRGYGASNGAPGPFSVETFANDLADLIDSLDLDPAVVIGHSMGATVAQRLAIDRPEAVEALVLIAPVPASGLPLSPKALDFLRGTIGNPQQAAKWFAGLTVTEQPPETMTLMLEAAATASPDAALESFASWQPGDFSAEAATIETPALVLAPDRDRPEFVKEHVADIIAGSRFEVVADCGHYALVDRPRELAAAIAAFIEEL